jgi:RNA polymerase sigma factor (sigma-70 family)
MMLLARDEVGLLQSFRDGERTALERVYRAYVESVTRVVACRLRRYCDGWSVSGGAVATELPDLVQEVFARAFDPRARGRFDGERQYGPYLAQIARNVVVDYLRRRQRQLTRAPALLLWDASAGRAPHEDDAFGDSRTMAIVCKYVACLPGDLRQVHQALYIHGLSQREAAAALGLGRQTIRTLETRLQEGLRNALGEIEGRRSPESVRSKPTRRRYPPDKACG